MADAAFTFLCIPDGFRLLSCPAGLPVKAYLHQGVPELSDIAWKRQTVCSTIINGLSIGREHREGLEYILTREDIRHDHFIPVEVSYGQIGLLIIDLQPPAALSMKAGYYYIRGEYPISA